jgi:hypothetical protein
MDTALVNDYRNPESVATDDLILSHHRPHASPFSLIAPPLQNAWLATTSFTDPALGA